MKILKTGLVLGIFLSLSAGANCKIVFENEVTEWEPMHKLFKYVEANKDVLVSKGYQLTYLNEDAIDYDWGGSIYTKRARQSKFLVMNLYDYKTETNKIYKTSFRNYNTGIKNLLQKLPECH